MSMQEKENTQFLPSFYSEQTIKGCALSHGFMEWVNTEEMSCWMFRFCFCTFPALLIGVCSIYLENQE